MKAFILETAAKATAETLRRGEIPFQKLQHQESQRTSPRHLAVPHSMKMWEPLVRPLTPERRLVVSTDALRSPLGTAAPTFQPHFQRNSIRTKTPRLQGSLPSSVRLGVSAVNSSGVLRFLILHLAVSFVVGVMPLQAEDSLWQRAQSAGEQLLSQGRYVEAKRNFETALGEAEEFGTTDPRRLQSLNSLAMVYQQQGQPAEADALYGKVLALAEKILGPKHSLVASVLNNLANLRGTQARFAEAEALYVSALSIEKEVYGEGHSFVAVTLDNLAMLQLSLGRYAEAEKNLLHALELSRKSAGPKHPETLTKMNNLAYLYSRLGRYRDSEQLYKKVLATREQTLGRENPTLAFTLNSLGEVFRLQGRHQLAEPLYRRALLIIEKVLGPEHLQAAPVLNNLAIISRVKKRFAEAEDFYLRAIAIKENAFGPQHLSLAKPLSNLAELYIQLQRYSEADRFYRTRPWGRITRRLRWPCSAWRRALVSSAVMTRPSRSSKRRSP